MIATVLAVALAAAPPSQREPWLPTLSASAVEVLQDTGRVIVRPFQPKLSDALVLAPLAVASALALRFDVRWHRQIRSRWPDPSVAGHRFSHWGSFMGEGWVDIGVFSAFGLAGGAKGERVFIEGFEALAATAVTSRALKLIFRLERPSFDPDHKRVFSARWLKADAMPSGHTMAAFATATILAWEYPMIAPLTYLLATYVGVARIQQSTHWASDVLIGAGLGFLFGRGSVELNRWLRLTPAVAPSGGGVALRGRF